MRTFLSISLLLLSGMAQAAELSSEELGKAQALAKDTGCLSCHSLTEKIVGPAYAKVADKYKDQADAAAGLVQSIQYGSKGKWGRIPMPAHSQLSPEELNLLARWVLTITP
jgi:cytochrome c